MADLESFPPITIILIISGNSKSAEKALGDLRKFGNLESNFLYVVNSSESDRDTVKAEIPLLLSEFRNSEYFENPNENGVIDVVNKITMELDSSNRDVFLLDSSITIGEETIREMSKILYANEKNGIVQPRSNLGLTAAIPVMNSDKNPRDTKESEAIFKQLRAHLPQSSIAPISTGPCLLIRRTLLANCGPIRQDYGHFDYAVMDFSWQINRLGFSSLLANHAYVTNRENVIAQPKVEQRDRKLINSRFPHHDSAIAHYFRYCIEPVDWFAEQIFSSCKKRILIDLFHLSPSFNGTTRNAISFIETLSAKASVYEHFEFTLVSNQEAIDHFNLKKYGFPTVSNEKLSELYDVGLSIAPISSLQQITSLNRHCVKWIACHFDIIGIRVNTLLEFNFARRQAVLDSLIWSDRIISISNSSLVDAKAYFGSDLGMFEDRSIVIYEGVAPTLTIESNDDLGFGAQVDDMIFGKNYILVIGNEFPHKHYPETLLALTREKLELHVVAFGKISGGIEVPGVTHIQGGQLSDEQVGTLFRNAKCVIFPSTYEGFGLPTVETASLGNQIILFESAVNHEIETEFGIADKVTYFSNLNELPDIVRDLSARHKLNPVQLRSLEDYNVDILEVVESVLTETIDLEKLDSRVRQMRRVETYLELANDQAREAQNRLASIETSTTARFVGLIQKTLNSVRRIKSLLR